MAIKHRVSLLLVSLAIFFQGGSRVSAKAFYLIFDLETAHIQYTNYTIFTLKNNCGYTVWPGIIAESGPLLGNGGFSLDSGASNQLTAPPGWSGRFWGRTGCNFDGSGSGTCATGDCGGKLQCNGAGGASPVTLAEFSIGSSSQDFYDVSVVDGFNVKLGILPSNGDCQYAGCVAELNANCPAELQVTSGGSVVACKSACVAFNQPQYCCTGAYSTPQTCPPTNYSMIFKQACPDAYSYAYDDPSSFRSCNGTDYTITFCP